MATNHENFPQQIDRLLNEVLSIKRTVERIPKPEEIPKNLDLDHVLEFLKTQGFQMSKSKMYKLCASKRIPHRHFGNRLVFNAKELIEWCEKQFKKNDDEKIDYDDMDINDVNKMSYGKDKMTNEQTEIMIAVYQISAFHTLIDKLEKIDYRAIKFPKKMTKLYAEMKEAPKDTRNASELMSNIWERINQLKISFEEQIVILSKEILALSKQEGVRIAFWGNEFHLYDSIGYWKKIDKDLIKEFLSETAIKSGIYTMIAKQNKKKEKLLEQIISDGIIVEIDDENEKDSNRVLINLLNGTFCIENGIGELKPHNPDDHLTYILHFNYEPEAKALKFQDFLNEILPNQNTQKVLIEYIGYCMTKGLHREKFLIAVGGGSNGKSTVQNIVVRMIGENNVCSYSLVDLCDNRGYALAQLPGKKINITTELGYGKINYDLLKQIVSGESVSARLPFGKPFNFKPECKLWFSTNTLPHGEPTLGFQRRLLLIEFNVIIPEKKQKRNLVDEICKDELPEIFNLALEGIHRLVKQGHFSYSKEIEQALDKYMKESDSVRLFMEDEGWKASDTNKILLKELNEKYREYCKNSGYTPCAIRKFGNRLRDIGIRVERSSGNYFYVFCEKCIIDENSVSIDLDDELSPIEKSVGFKIFN
jgi:putative DNA primase/helicase